MKTQKQVVVIFLLIGCITIYSQEFRDRHIRKLENLGITFKTEYSASEQATKELHQVLHYDFKRKAKLTFGTSLLIVGLGGLIGGLQLTDSRGGFQGVIAAGCLTVGAAGVGTSIPLFIGSRSSKKKRDQLKTQYLSESTHNTSALFRAKATLKL